MSWIEKNLKWIMLIAGLLTCSMLYAVIDPHGALRSTFGDTVPDGPLVQIVVRNWGALITLVGALLVYGAYRPAVRPVVLVLAVVSKLVFIGLVLTYGQAYLGKAGLTVGFDLMVAALLALGLVQTLRQPVKG
jgi:hypothetical protein